MSKRRDKHLDKVIDASSLGTAGAAELRRRADRADVARTLAASTQPRTSTLQPPGAKGRDSTSGVGRSAVHGVAAGMDFVRDPRGGGGRPGKFLTSRVLARGADRRGGHLELVQPTTYEEVEQLVWGLFAQALHGTRPVSLDFSLLSPLEETRALSFIQGFTTTRGGTFDFLTDNKGNSWWSLNSPHEVKHFADRRVVRVGLTKVSLKTYEDVNSVVAAVRVPGEVWIDASMLSLSDYERARYFVKGLAEGDARKFIVEKETQFRIVANVRRSGAKQSNESSAADVGTGRSHRRR